MSLNGLFLLGRSSHLLFLCPKFRGEQARFDERRAERIRIAQDLHDTVLQDFHALSMLLHAVLDEVPANSAARPRLTRILELTSSVMAQIRLAVGGLRSPKADSNDLAEALAQVARESGTPDQVDFRIRVLGFPRQFHPIVRDDVYCIGREALWNAFRHSKANHIEVELEYAVRRFRLVVRDNGSGIDPQVLHAGRDGHWGIASMRERAQRVGARFRMWSRAGAGTELELSIANRLAFETRTGD